MTLRIPLTFICLFVLLGATAFTILPAPLAPSSFYGSVKIDSSDVPDGTPVEASIRGQVFARTTTTTYQNQSVYALDVPGDDPATPAIEGGNEGDTVTFTIGALSASQTGTWHSGTNVNLDLSASSPATLPPPATPILPSATNYRIIRATNTSTFPPAHTRLPSATATSTRTFTPSSTPIEPTATETSFDPAASTSVAPTATMTPLPAQSSPERDVPQSATMLWQMITLYAFVTASVILFFVARYLRRGK